MDAWKLFESWMKDPTYRSAYEAYEARMRRAERLTGWMRRIPGVGSVVYCFWFLALTEEGGVGGLLDGMSFSFLNDGIRPTLWSTYMNVIDHPRYDGIWPQGAPRNRREADIRLANADLLTLLRHEGKP